MKLEDGEEIEFEERISDPEKIKELLLSEEIHGIDIEMDEDRIMQIRLEGIGFDYYIIHAWAGMILFYHGRYIDPTKRK